MSSDKPLPPSDKNREIKHYSPVDAGDYYNENLGDPGEYPYTRGIHAEMYSKRLWTMRQYAGYATAEESNRRYRYLLEQGTTGLSVAFDLPTQIGYDSDNELSEGEVGRVGVAIDTIDDVGRLFEGIELERVSTSMTINATAPILLAMYAAVGERQGADIGKLNGTVQNDILKEYTARGTYIYPPGESMRLVTDLMAFCARRMPSWNTISVSGYHIREAGSTAGQELAFTLANAIAYCEAAIAAGLVFDEFAPRLSFFFNAHSNFFEEVAKYRAARRIWARTAKERFGATSEKSMKLRFHTQTAGSTLTAQQPEVNAVRTTLQALAAVMGGTQSLHTNALDEALALPTEETVRLALRTQQVIAYESGVTSEADPLGGSWYLESLTDRLEEEAVEYIKRIDEMGGAAAAIESGYVQGEIAKSAYEQQKRIEAGEQLIIGANSFKTDEEPLVRTLEIDPAVQANQLEKLENFRKGRDGSLTEKALDRLRSAAESDGNTTEHILECVKSGATLGEVSDALREVFGEYAP